MNKRGARETTVLGQSMGRWSVAISRRIVSAIAGATIATLAVVGPAQAAEAIPAKLQAAIFAKVFKYSISLKAKGKVKILVVTSNESGRLANELTQAFIGIGIPTRSAVPATFATSLQDATVVYVATDALSVAAKAKGRGVLTITDDGDLVRSGDVAVGIELKDRGIRLIVHMGCLGLAKHRISAQVLQLAEVIRS